MKSPTPLSPITVVPPPCNTVCNTHPPPPKHQYMYDDVPTTDNRQQGGRSDRNQTHSKHSNTSTTMHSSAPGCLVDGLVVYILYSCRHLDLCYSCRQYSNYA